MPLDAKRPAPTPPEAPRAVPPASVSRNKSTIPSIVSEGLHITGNLVSDGDVQIDGHIEGDVKGQNLTVGPSGEIRGKVMADRAEVSGTVWGEIHAKAVALTRTAKVKSDLIQDSLTIEAGAQFEGNVRRMTSAKSHEPTVLAAKPAAA
jgi:cytoskeletal protein CcmA (bactofilin family)